MSCGSHLFHFTFSVIAEEDADRVWSSVTEAVKIMAEEEGVEV
jgi:hypothetical protein